MNDKAKKTKEKEIGRMVEESCERHQLARLQEEGMGETATAPVRAVSTYYSPPTTPTPPFLPRPRNGRACTYTIPDEETT